MYLSSVYCRVGAVSETRGTTGQWAALACPAECLNVLTYKELNNDENYLLQLLSVLLIFDGFYTCADGHIYWTLNYILLS